jgi:hypothetical protein
MRSWGRIPGLQVANQDLFTFSDGPSGAIPDEAWGCLTSGLRGQTP